MLSQGSVQDIHVRNGLLQVEKTPGLGDALITAKQMASPIYMLFPGAEARDLADMVRQHSLERHLPECSQVQQAEHHTTPTGSHSTQWEYLLIAIDGTWRQGKEIFKVGSEDMRADMQLSLRVHMSSSVHVLSARCSCLYWRDSRQMSSTYLWTASQERIGTVRSNVNLL